MKWFLRTKNAFSLNFYLLFFFFGGPCLPGLQRFPQVLSCWTLVFSFSHSLTLLLGKNCKSVICVKFIEPSQGPLYLKGCLTLLPGEINQLFVCAVQIQKQQKEHFRSPF